MSCKRVFIKCLHLSNVGPKHMYIQFIQPHSLNMNHKGRIEQLKECFVATQPILVKGTNKVLYTTQYGFVMQWSNISGNAGFQLRLPAVFVCTMPLGLIQ